jgi:hypothetical protein
MTCAVTWATRLGSLQQSCPYVLVIVAFVTLADALICG